MRTLLLILLLAFSAHAQVLDPQSAGRAGVHDLTQKSGTVLGWNPAILAADRGFRMSFDIPSVGAAAANNSFSVGYWNDHFGGDHYYNEAEKADILSKIPGGGLRTNVQAAAPLFGFSYNRFGFRAVAQTASQLVVPKDLVALSLKGNEKNHMYSLSEMSGETQSLIDYSAGFGYQFEQDKIPDLYFGAAFHFYQGVYLAKFEQTDGQIMATDSQLTADVVIRGVTAERGDGVGFDIGALAVISEKLELGLSLRQIGARLTWDVKKNYLNSYYVDSTGIQPDTLGSDGSISENGVHKLETTYTGGAVETKLPVIVQANFHYRMNPRWTFMGELAVQIENTVMGKAGVQVGAAAEYSPFNHFVLQGGAGLGGPWQTQLGIGGGLRFQNYDLDIGGTWYGGAFNSVRGVGVGISQRLKF
jgi:hypothetical protein